MYSYTYGKTVGNAWFLMCVSRVANTLAIRPPDKPVVDVYEIFVTHKVDKPSQASLAGIAIKPADENRSLSQ